MEEFESLIQDIQLLEDMQQLQQLLEVNLDLDLTDTPFPGFQLPENLIPEELNIPLTPFAWILCDNGIGQLLDFLGTVIRNVISGLKFVLDGIVSVIKGIVGLIMEGLKELVDLLKYAVQMLKQLYCQSNHIRLIIAKTTPVLRLDTGLPPIPDGLVEPPPPEVFRPKPSVPTDPNNPNGGQQFPDATATQVFNALLLLRETLLNKVGANILQFKENQDARYADLRSQLLFLLPPELRKEVEEETEPETEEEKLAAEKRKYLQGLDLAIESVEQSIAKILSDEVDANKIFETLLGVDSTLNPKPINKAIADLPPLDPITPDNPYDVTPDPTGVTYYNLLIFVQRLTQKTAAETLSNNVIRLDAFDRAYYQSTREIIDAVRGVQSKEQLRLQKQYEARIKALEEAYQKELEKLKAAS